MKKLKLNLGCGRDYRKGWLNADIRAEIRKDAAFPAWNIPSPGDSVNEIMAGQLIEHLGFFKTRYFLSEAFRVLKPGGSLTIETPDIEKSFRLFLKSGRAGREAVMQWLYGLETPGMGHIFCFPKELLKELAEAAGFRIIKISKFRLSKFQPALRLKAVKMPGDKTALIISALRKQILKSGLADLGENEAALAEREKLIDSFRLRLAAYFNTGMDIHITSCLSPLAAEHPAITALFFKAAAPYVPPAEELLKRAAKTALRRRPKRGIIKP